MRYSKNEICPEILRSLAFHIVLYKIHKKVLLSVLYAIKDTWYRKMVKFIQKVGLTNFPVQVYFTNLVGMFEIRVNSVLCSFISKNNGENIKILPYPLCRRIRFCDNIFTNNVNNCTPLQP
jgi:hypothetical protein